MKACVIQQFGPLDQVRVEDVKKPSPNNGELLVRVRAASINPIDWKLIDGSLQRLFPVALPRILGRDCAGEVVESSAPAFRPGDRILAVTDAKRNGTHAQFAVVSALQACAIPDVVSDIEAVAVGNSGATALTCLIDVAKLRAGQRVLIHAGAGAVGALAVQIARHVGAEVIATCGAADMDYVYSLGASRVIDYRKEDFAAVISGCNAVVDLVGGDVHRRSFDVIKAGGVLAYVHALPIDPPTRSDILVQRAEVKASGEQLRHLLELTQLGAVKPRIASVVNFPEAPLAYRRAAGKHPPGKIVLKMSP